MIAGVSCLLLSVPSGPVPVTALRFRDGLTLGVGTAGGQVLMYDIRATQPLLVKEHHYNLPVHSLSYQKEEGVVLSADKKSLRLWHDHSVGIICVYRITSGNCR